MMNVMNIWLFYLDRIFHNNQMTALNIQEKTIAGCCDQRTSNYEDYANKVRQ